MQATLEPGSISSVRSVGPQPALVAVQDANMTNRTTRRSMITTASGSDRNRSSSEQLQSLGQQNSGESVAI